MELPTPLTTPEVEFRKHHREAWTTFLESPAGRSFFQVIFSYSPAAHSATEPHRDSHLLGQHFFYKAMVALMFYNLKLPMQDENIAVPQDYPREDDNSEQPE